MTDTITIADEFEIRVTELDDGVLVSGHGDSRAISLPELRKMVQTDEPVEVR